MSKATEQGEAAISIDEPVYSWPAYFHPGHSVTVRRKLTHNWSHEATRQRIEAALSLSPAELDEQIASNEAAERAIVQQMLDLLDAWTLRLNLDVGGGYVVLAGAMRKPFATDWEAQSYIKQRKDDLADLFAEMYPPLTTTLAPYFYKFGFLPGKFQGYGTPHQFETDPDE